MDSFFLPLSSSCFSGKGWRKAFVEKEPYNFVLNIYNGCVAWEVWLLRASSRITTLDRTRQRRPTTTNGTSRDVLQVRPTRM